MESLVTGDRGIAGLLAGIILVLCFNLLMHIGRIMFDFMSKKNQVSENNVQKLTDTIEATQKTLSDFQNRLTSIERDMNEVLKFRVDFRRLFAALKFIAGDRWPEAKKAMKDYDME